MRLALAFIVTILPMTNASAEEASPPPLAQSVATARAANKPLVLDFYTTWCGPCKEFKKNVLPRPEVQKALAEVHFVQYDAEAGPGIEAAREFGVNSYPTFVVVDATGQSRRVRKGSMDAASFVTWVGEARLAVLTEAELKRRAKAEPDNATLLVFVARHYRREKNTSAAKSYYDKAVKAGKGSNVAAEAAWECMELLRYDRARSQMVQQRIAFASMFPGHSNATSSFVLAAASKSIPRAKQRAIANKLVAAAGPEQLNSLVYDLLAANEPEAALRAAHLQVEAEPDDANVYDTRAEVLHVLGRKDEAVASSDQALELGKAHKDYIAFKKNAERFARGNPEEEDPAVIGRRFMVLRTLKNLPGDYPAYQDEKIPEDPARKAAREQYVKNRTFRRAVDKSLASVAKKCASKKATENVYVRFVLKDAAGKPKRVWVMEPALRGSLRSCLKRELRRAVFPEPAGDERTFTKTLDVPAKKSTDKSQKASEKP
jgi:thiol-disulfide isomerase/thioredoxin